MFDVDVANMLFDHVWFDFYAFWNKSKHGLNRELVGDELLISAVDVSNLFHQIKPKENKLNY